MTGPAVKFCGLTRPEDAAQAARLGARFVGAIFAGGPRLIDAPRAATLFAAARQATGGNVPRAVGVMGAQRAAEIVRLVDDATLDVVQLHGDPTPDDVASVRRLTSAQIWAVVRVDGTALPDGIADLVAAADALVLDAKVVGRLGGTGVSLDWLALADEVGRVRGTTPIVLAGGLTPANVAQAIAALEPDVVDVSSGVESAPGVKDHSLMHAFAREAATAGASQHRFAEPAS